MVLISKEERKALDKVGLLRYKKVGFNGQDQNFQVVNREHLSRDKSIYVVEEPEIMAFLGRYDNLNLQKINVLQLKSLREGGFVNDSNSQYWGTYNPNAVAYEDREGNWRIKKTSKMMLFLGLWKTNRARKEIKELETYYGKPNDSDGLNGEYTEE
jgi:hypothetical protein